MEIIIAVIAALLIAAFIFALFIVWDLYEKITTAAGGAWGNLGTTGQNLVTYGLIAVGALAGLILILGIAGVGINVNKKGVSTTASGKVAGGETARSIAKIGSDGAKKLVKR